MQTQIADLYTYEEQASFSQQTQRNRHYSYYIVHLLVKIITDTQCMVHTSR